MWRSKRQNCITTSTAEAEFVALSVACKEVIAMKNLFERITGTKMKPAPVMYEDNNSALTSVKSHENGRLRHLDISYFYCREQVEKKNVEVVRVDTKNQEADFLTKPLEYTLFENCRNKTMGVKNSIHGFSKLVCALNSFSFIYRFQAQSPKLSGLTVVPSSNFQYLLKFHAKCIVWDSLR